MRFSSAGFRRKIMILMLQSGGGSCHLLYISSLFYYPGNIFSAVFGKTGASASENTIVGGGFLNIQS